MSQEKETKEQAPHAPTPEELEAREDLETFSAISALAEHKGGKLLLAKLRQDITSCVERVESLRSGDERELRGAAHDLHAFMTLYKTLSLAKENAKLAEEALSALLTDEKR